MEIKTQQDRREGIAREKEVSTRTYTYSENKGGV
jgi:hypothetical protein